MTNMCVESCPIPNGCGMDCELIEILAKKYLLKHAKKMNTCDKIEKLTTELYMEIKFDAVRTGFNRIINDTSVTAPTLARIISGAPVSVKKLIEAKRAIDKKFGGK